MITGKDIKPIPKYIQSKIKAIDQNCSYYKNNNYVRFYAYLTKIKGQLCKITVAVKCRYSKWYCKQVALHTINKKDTLIKDIVYYYGMPKYVVGWYEQGLTKTRKWYEYEEWCPPENFNCFDPFAKIINKEYALKFDKYKYSAADEYPYSDLMKYLKLYEQYPEAEYLVKLGLSYWATMKTILTKLKKDKNFRKWLIKNKDSISFHGYYATTLLYAYKNNMNLNEAQRFIYKKKSFDHESDYAEIRKIFKDKDLQKFFEYIELQNTNYHSYLDYLNACNFLHIDMKEDKNRFPHDFKKWHDIRIDEYHTAKLEMDEKERKTFYQKFAKIAEKYLSLQRNQNEHYVAIIAKSPRDLIIEGNKLCHCVGRMNYDQKFVREESLIFFIRKFDSQDNPFVTIEYSPKTHRILQCYGIRDSRPTDDVLDFVNRIWLPYANRKLKQIA